MPITGTQSTARLDIGQALLEYSGPVGLIASIVAPIFKTMLIAATFDKITRESLANIPDTKKGRGGKYNRIQWGTEPGSYSCDEHGLENVLEDRDRAKYAKQFQAEMVAAKIPYNSLLLAWEKRVADMLMNTTTFTGTPLYKDYSASPWSTASTDILAQVDFGRTKMKTNAGVLPNTLVVDFVNFLRLINNDDIRDAVKYTAIPTWEIVSNLIAAYLGLQRVVVAYATYNTAGEGLAFSGSGVWSENYALLGYYPTDPEDFSQPILARSFLFAEDSPSNPVVEQYRDDTARGDVFRVRHDIDSQIMDPYYGFLLKVAS